MTILLLLLTILLVFTTTLLVLEKLLFQPFKGTATKWLHHSDLNGRKVLFKSGNNNLLGWFYGEENDNAKGLIIISHAMGVTSEYYIPEILYFVDQGYKVFAFDNTGYGYNKGLFLGFSQAVKDIKSAIQFADDHTLPITLLGHSMGGYAVCNVLSCDGISSHDIRNVIAYSGFDNITEIIESFFGVNHNLVKKLAADVICLGQALLFGKMFFYRSSDAVNSNPDIKFIIVHGSKDEEVEIDSTALISKKLTNTNVKKIIVTEECINTHMGVIRNENIHKPVVNTPLLDAIITCIVY